MINILTLTDFRNHAVSRIITNGRQNVVITGPNGSGKTAILEAVSMLGGDRGMRGAAMVDVARFAASGGFSAHANLADDTELAVYFEPGDSNRRAKIDGDNAPLSDLATHLRIVWLTPKEDRLFLDSVSDRRAFFDRLVASFDARHSGRTARLSKLLTERAAALKRHADDNWLGALELQIAQTAVAIAAARIQYAAEINYFLKSGAVSVCGMIESWLMGADAAHTEELYLEYLASNRELLFDKMVIDGAHKSDFGVFNVALNLPAAITSTGQQKSILVDLILAHTKLVREKTGKIPIVLLDEAVAHLDANARKYMFDELAGAGAQIWTTGLDAEIFRDLKNAVFVTCHNGAISNILVSEQ